MAIERQEFIEELKDSYSAYYNIIEREETEYPLSFCAEYLSRSEKFWLSKSIPVWGNETNEFCYVFSAERFDKSTVTKCIDFALDDGLPRVKPHKEHQYTNIKTVFVAEAFDDDALKETESRKFSKTYHHSLWGYSDLLTCAVNVENEKVVTNRAGDTLKQYFRKLFKALNAKAKP